MSTEYVRRRRPKVTVPVERRRLPAETWPAADQALWKIAIGRTGPYEIAGPGAHWRPDTRRIREGAWGQYLSYLQATGNLKEDEAPHERLTFDRLTGLIRSARAVNSDHSVHQQIRDLQYVARAMMPERDWSWVARHPAGPTSAEARAARKKKEPFDPGVLLAAAEAVINEIDTDKPSVAVARRFRDMCMALLLLFHAVRRKNLTSLTLGQHLRADGGVVRLVLDHDETKALFPTDHIVREPLLGYLVRYLTVHRPRLLLGGNTSQLGEDWARNVPDPTGGVLWISEDGTPLPYSMLWQVFHDIGIDLLGRPINPHLFRHVMATTILTIDPTKIAMARDALGHRNERVTNQYYDQSGAAPSQELYRKRVAELRAWSPDDLGQDAG